MNMNEIYISGHINNRRPVMITKDNQINVYDVEQNYSSKSITFGTSKTNCNLRWLNKYA